MLSYKSDIDGLLGFELTISHEVGCDFVLNDNAFIADYQTKNNITKIKVPILRLKSHASFEPF